MSSSPTVAPTPEPELNQLNQLGLFGIILGALVGAAILYCGVYVYRNRQLRVIKVHQPLFLITICIGLFVWAMAVIPYSLDDGVLSEKGADRACMATQWLVVLGYTLCFASLYAKLYRINKLFHGGQRFQRVKVGYKDVVRPFLVLFSINLFLLVAWTVVDPLRWTREPISSSTDYWDTYGFCKSGTAGEAFAYAIETVNFVSLVMTCVQAWKARDISVEFSESKYLAVGIFNWIELQIVALPATIALGNDNPHVSYLLEASLLLMQVLSMLLVLFVPIFSQVRKYRRQVQQRENGGVANTVPTVLATGQVHVTGLTTTAATTTTPRLTRISGLTNNTITKSSVEGGGRTAGGDHTSISINNNDDTQMTALKNRIATLEESVEDMDEIKKRNLELVRRIKELELMCQHGDEENGESRTNDGG